MKTLYFLCIFFIPLFADDGNKTGFEDIEMNINNENYILFEDESLVVCDRETDEYLVEITHEFDLYVRGKKVEINEYQEDLLQDYYIAQYILFTKRNRIGAKGIEIGIQSARLAAKAVGGALMLIATGFDEEEERQFEENIERESEEIEKDAEIIEYHAEEFEEQIYKVNNAERIMSREIDILQGFALYVDKDIEGFNIEYNDND